jgi:hypothetical protein
MVGDWYIGDEYISDGRRVLRDSAGELSALSTALVNGELGGGRVYVATVDVAGQDEGATEVLLTNPGRDYTVATVVEVRPGGGAEGQGSGVGYNAGAGEQGYGWKIGPVYWAVDVFVDHGSRHFQESGVGYNAGRPSLARRLLGFLNHWGVGHVVVDASGVGQGLADWLMAEMGKRRVTAYVFSGKGQKAMLGSRFVALVETNRFKYWCGDEREVGSDGWWFWQQVGACGYHLPPRGIRDL